MSKVGEVNKNNKGSEMILVRYKDDSDIDVFFPEYNYTKTTRYIQFKNGTVKCPYDRTVHGVGYIGEGEYVVSINKKNTKAYTIWNNMLRRCYDEEFHKREPSYIGCEVCDEWHNFQNFAQWYEKNYYEVEGERMCLDKDIINKGNKIYSPDNCVFVPVKINNLFIKRDNKRGDLPIGVKREYNKFTTHMSNTYLGLFNTPHEAFLMYKLNKELLIQGMTREYKDKIPVKLYNALMNYKVDEND